MAELPRDTCFLCDKRGFDCWERGEAMKYPGGHVSMFKWTHRPTGHFAWLGLTGSPRMLTGQERYINPPPKEPPPRAG